MRFPVLLCTTFGHARWSYCRLRIRSTIQTAFVISDQIFASESRRGIDKAPRTDPCWDSCYCRTELLKLAGINDRDTRYSDASADNVLSSLSLAGDTDGRNNKLDIIGCLECKSIWIFHIYESVVENPVKIAWGMVYFVSSTLYWLNELCNFWQKLKVKKKYFIITEKPIKICNIFCIRTWRTSLQTFISRWQNFEHRSTTK
jgi:hypothetical protein